MHRHSFLTLADFGTTLNMSPSSDLDITISEVLEKALGMIEPSSMVWESIVWNLEQPRQSQKIKEVNQQIL